MPGLPYMLADESRCGSCHMIVRTDKATTCTTLGCPNKPKGLLGEPSMNLAATASLPLPLPMQKAS
ncbi:MAG: hypothetical protein JWN50_331 [Parcubacteria group bacterium]|nr:hypothetical protein [Parcubacteria group bacterium]